MKQATDPGGNAPVPIIDITPFTTGEICRRTDVAEAVRTVMTEEIGFFVMTGCTKLPRESWRHGSPTIISRAFFDRCRRRRRTGSASPVPSWAGPMRFRAGQGGAGGNAGGRTDLPIWKENLSAGPKRPASPHAPCGREIRHHPDRSTSQSADRRIGLPPGAGAPYPNAEPLIQRIWMTEASSRLVTLGVRSNPRPEFLHCPEARRGLSLVEPCSADLWGSRSRFESMRYRLQMEPKLAKSDLDLSQGRYSAVIAVAHPAPATDCRGSPSPCPCSGSTAGPMLEGVVEPKVAQRHRAPSKSTAPRRIRNAGACGAGLEERPMDAKRWVLSSLRNGVESAADGKPFTSARCHLLVLNRHRGEQSTSPGKPFLASVSEFRADGDHAVVFKLSGRRHRFASSAASLHASQFAIVPDGHARLEHATSAPAPYVVENSEVPAGWRILLDPKPE